MATVPWRTMACRAVATVPRGDQEMTEHLGPSSLQLPCVAPSRVAWVEGGRQEGKGERSSNKH